MRTSKKETKQAARFLERQKRREKAKQLKQSKPVAWVKIQSYRGPK